jgi:hypothetical protein
MPNDVVLDPTVHHLFAKDWFNRGKSSRSWPLYPRCGHNLSLPRCPPFVEAGTPDLLWLYKSQRKAWKKGGFWGEGTEKLTQKQKKAEKIEQKKPRIKTQAKPRKGLSNRGGGAENQRRRNPAKSRGKNTGNRRNGGKLRGRKRQSQG